MILTLMRDDPQAAPAARTFGELHWADDQILLQTLERPWIPAPDGSPGGDPNLSCVPIGTYDLVLHDTPEHPQTWALVNPALGVFHEAADVPADFIGTPRIACLIHSANLVVQLEGCIGVGLTRSALNGEPDIADSVNAFAELKEAVPWVEGHQLIISNGA